MLLIKGSPLLCTRRLHSSVKQFIKACDICQRNEYETLASPGLLQSLPIPEKVWEDVSMYFIEGLPTSASKSMVLEVVDKLSKYAYFLALQHPYTAANVAHVDLDNVFKLH
ncbi:hypothetical protein ACH5RR_041064 [Cinchona calisaya]|uniref:Integrase zinc-binding domain-containing protein n=1 Tax=Cinchona calisaya TaxID=153742 RepID=A0ABD2XXQ5_9GENT